LVEFEGFVHGFQGPPAGILHLVLFDRKVLVWMNTVYGLLRQVGMLESGIVESLGGEMLGIYSVVYEMVAGVDDVGLLGGIFVVSQCMVRLIRMNL